MLELFSLFTALKINEGFAEDVLPTNIPISWVIMTLIISFGSAYIAYCCNQYETPATRALSTIIGFFFSGFYLLYYLIVHVIFDRKCSSRGIENIVKNMSKK